MNSYGGNNKTQRNIMIGGGVLLVIIVVLVFSMTMSKKETTDTTTVAKSVLRSTTPAADSLQIVVKDSNDDLSTQPLSFFIPNILPKGIILAWNGTDSDIPVGWALCDGKDGRPDLRNRFIFGYNPDRPNDEQIKLRKLDGNWSQALAIEHMPPHRHQFCVGGGGWDAPRENGKFYNEGGPVDGHGNSNCGHDQPLTRSTGGGQHIWMMPPYMVLCYIIKV